MKGKVSIPGDATAHATIKAFCYRQDSNPTEDSISPLVRRESHVIEAGVGESQLREVYTSSVIHKRP